ncbi:protein FAM136A-like [Apostichopus japonicus]|uniref:protein FAM136A-like n=1 Tax=Stichopus japonicus TaxID=307972 RepID=UPI003AB13DC0
MRLSVPRLDMAEFSADLQASRAKADESFSRMVDDIDRSVFRKMQREMYLCSARCCENPQYQMSDVQSCAERCSQPIQQGQNYMQQEFNDFLDRVKRCDMQCLNDVKDRLGASVGGAQTDKLMQELEGCLRKSTEKHLGLLPTMSKRIKANLQGMS